MSDLTELAIDLGTLENKIVDDQFLQIVNQYIPIDKIELLMDKIFQKWNVEVKDVSHILNSIAVTVRLHYRNPVTEKMEYQDGVGASKIQVEKGQNASNLQAIKPDAITMALPSAKSEAIKDAADHIGTIFGRNVSRKDTIEFNPTYATTEAKEAMAKQREEIRSQLNANN